MRMKSGLENRSGRLRPQQAISSLEAMSSWASRQLRVPMAASPGGARVPLAAILLRLSPSMRGYRLLERGLVSLSIVD